MSFSTFSVSLTLLFAITLLWILMDLHPQYLTPAQKKWFPAVVVLLVICNHFLRVHIGAALYAKTILLSLHLPVFLLYRCLTKYSGIKMAFMILSAFVFTAPSVIVTTLVKESWPDNTIVLALSNIITYLLILCLAYTLLRKGFSYLLKYGDDALFLRFSLLPSMYYIYTFAAQRIDPAIWNSIFSNVGFVVRIIPTLQMLLFYFLLLQNFRDLSEKREMDTTQAALTQQLSAAEEQLAHLSSAQIQTAIYQHDMRHHLNAISAYLSANKFKEAMAYIKKVQSDVDSISPKQFCENEIVNLMCSSFFSEAERIGVRMAIDTKLPRHLTIPDPELCALLSNGLENALNAVFELPEPLKWVDFYCEVKKNKLLLEIRNPYLGEIILCDDLPTAATASPEHGYGCRSIRSIVERHNGLCTFEPNNGIFVLRIVIPLHTANHI